MKRSWKSAFAIALAGLIALFCLAGCGETSSSDATGDDAASTANTATYKIGICQLVQHDALDAATEGFEAALTEKLGDRVTFDLQNASGESTNCTTIVSKFVSDEVDLIMANATGALTAAAEATQTIPVVGTSITDYPTALGITDWTGKTGFNVTGASDLAPLAEQAQMIVDLVPDAQTVGILYCSAEPNSKYQSDIIEEELAKLNVTTKVYTFVDSNDVTSVTKQAVADCDVLYIPTDNTAASNAEAINNVAEPAGIPIIAGEEGICEGCGVATLSISYYDMGYQAGLMAYEILENGADPAEMDIQYSESVTKKYIADRASALNITIPDDYVAIEVEG
jgi:putative ABC transport system substrate-binding protein